MCRQEEIEKQEELDRILSMLICIGCSKKPSEIQEYIDAAKEDVNIEYGKPMTPEYYVYIEEGTLNLRNGHFTCTDCYIKMGQPSSPTGWVAP